MAIHKGVTSLDGHTAPATGAVQSRESTQRLGNEEESDADGISTYFVPHKHVRKEVVISGVGDAELSLVVPAAVAKNAVTVTRAKQQEFQNALPKFERTAVGFFDLPTGGVE